MGRRLSSVQFVEQVKWSAILFRDIIDMSKEIITFNRQFQIWSYIVGHSQLLLRSTKSPDHPTRVDIFFKNVKSIQLPTTIDDFSIVESDVESVQALSVNLNDADLRNRRVFLVHGVNCTGYVVAGFMDCREDEGEYNSPSPFEESWKFTVK